ncbi:hypothetical protein AAVH_16561 [Aphelenchoides avenae]|nr:hypothetical protein AAVH_16561 [Aphelenchus avenae]
MADQIKLRRRQKKMRAMRSTSDPSTIPTSNAQSLPARSEKDCDTHSANRFAINTALPPISTTRPPPEVTPLPVFSQLFSALEFQRQALQHNLALFGRIPMNI